MRERRRFTRRDLQRAIELDARFVTRCTTSREQTAQHDARSRPTARPRWLFVTAGDAIAHGHLKQTRATGAHGFWRGIVPQSPVEVGPRVCTKPPGNFFSSYALAGERNDEVVTLNTNGSR